MSGEAAAADGPLRVNLDADRREVLAARAVAREARLHALIAVAGVERAARAAGAGEEFAPHVRRLREALCDGSGERE